ncbi:hypothetical protein L3067_04190 [Xanthomonas sp. PPL568]|uniref:hypothetical protein n=1 Tax=Xanthomonas indica TaxID=2912242 RepID=UPI001F586604|nr:hypothetical protein [Xanthomonas indica]MCI2243807.1 hypothetical protein [Xanthomonas indica]
MSRSERVREWLKAAGGAHTAAAVSDALGASGRERTMIGWTLREMMRSGQLMRDGVGRSTRYEFVQMPTRPAKLTKAQRNANRAAAARAAHHARGGRSLEQVRAEQQARRDEKEAERARRRAARAARVRTKHDRQRDAEKKRQQRQAAGGTTRAERLAKLAAQRDERAAAKAKKQRDRMQRVGNRAGLAPVQQPAVQAGPVETVEQFLARGGRVQSLPGLQAAPPPRTIPTWRNAA